LPAQKTGSSFRIAGRDVAQKTGSSFRIAGWDVAQGQYQSRQYGNCYRFSASGLAGNTVTGAGLPSPSPAGFAAMPA
jgi:hypothetical protein